MAGMSQNLSDVHKLLRITEAELERLYSTVDAAESTQLVERAVDLTTRVLELKNAVDEIHLKTNSPSPR